MSAILTTLANGVRVVTDCMPEMNGVSLGIWVAAGARNETEEQNGIAHFLEHMAFKGTDTRGPKTIAKEIEDVGGYINAYTSRDATAYYVNVLKADLGRGFDLIQDIVLNSTFDEKELESERGVIIQEIERQYDTPDRMVFNLLNEAAYPGQAYGRSVLGPVENIKKFSRHDFLDFTGAHYGPEQLIVSASGPVSHTAMLSLVQNSYLGCMCTTTRESHESPIWVEGEQREVKDLSQAQFALAFKGPEYSSPDYYLSRLYATALGGGMSSRLFQKIREEHGLCYSIFASASSHDDTGSLTIYSGTSGEDVEKLAYLVIDELKASAGTIDEEELAKCKARVKASALMSLDSHSSRTDSNGRQLATQGRLRKADEIEREIDRIEVADLNEYAYKFLANASPALGLYGKVEKAPLVWELKDSLLAG